METAQLEQAIRLAVPEVRFVKERHLRRLLIELRDRDDDRGHNLHRPHWFTTEQVRKLGPFPETITRDAGSRLLLLVDPADLFDPGIPTETLWRYYWREVFRGVLYRTVIDTGVNRWSKLDEAVRVDADFLFSEDKLLAGDPNTCERYATLVAEFLTHFHFGNPEPWVEFPSADIEQTLAIIRLDVQDDEILTRCRPPGTSFGIRPTESLHPQQAVRPIPARRVPQLVAQAERATMLKNDVRAAILYTRAASAKPDQAVEFQGAATAAIQSRFLARLAALRQWDIATQSRWDSALVAILEPASWAYWSQAAKGLYDLQMAVDELETEHHTIDPAGWILSFGQQSLIRRLLWTRHTILLRYLNSARNHFAKADVPSDLKSSLREMLDTEIAAAERELRIKVMPVMVRVFDEVGLRPENRVESVARDKLVAELVDRMCSHGHIRLADLRDAIARNRLKLPDLSGPVEFFRGDVLLRADARLSDELDGVYHRGEIYLRWIQRASAVAFGTGLGRFFTKYVAIPFGGAILTVEFSKYIASEFRMVAGWVSGLVKETATEQAPAEVVGEVVKQAAGHHHAPLFTTDSVVAIFILAVFFLGLIHVPSFRSACGKALRWVGRSLRLVFVSLPRYLWRLPWVRTIRNNVVTRFVADRIGWPIVVGLLVGGFMWVFGASPERCLRWGGGLFVALAIVNNTPAGRRIQDRFEEFMSDCRRFIFVDLIPNLISFFVWAFRELLGAVDRWLYTVDEWFRFRPGQSHSLRVLKTFLALLWFPIEYVVRFAFYLLIEPQVNPLKHFPVVTVSHKLLLPMIPSLHQSTGLSVELIGGVVWGIPGIFGFVVWELKENWRLYQANRPATLKPVPIGHHGETMRGLLRPGFHSGAIPSAYRKIRHAYRWAERKGLSPNIEKHLHNLHHIEHAVESFVERELVALVDCHGECETVQIELGLQRVVARIQLQNDAPAIIEFLRIDDQIRGRVIQPGFLERLPPNQRAKWDQAIIGLMAMGAVNGPAPTWTEWVAWWNVPGPTFDLSRCTPEIPSAPSP